MSGGEEEWEDLLLLLLTVIIFHESIPSLCLLALIKGRAFRCGGAAAPCPPHHTSLAPEEF